MKFIKFFSTSTVFHVSYTVWESFLQFYKPFRKKMSPCRRLLVTFHRIRKKKKVMARIKRGVEWTVVRERRVLAAERPKGFPGASARETWRTVPTAIVLFLFVFVVVFPILPTSLKDR